MRHSYENGKSYRQLTMLVTREEIDLSIAELYASEPCPLNASSSNIEQSPRSSGRRQPALPLSNSRARQNTLACLSAWVAELNELDNFGMVFYELGADEKHIFGDHLLCILSSSSCKPVQTDAKFASGTIELPIIARRSPE
jgi:hypothetical protein